MKIPIPEKIRFTTGMPIHFNNIVPVILRQYISLAFWISPLAFWKLWDLIEKIFPQITF